MALPYPSMSFVPLDILTAEEMNHMVANDQYVGAKFPIQTSDLGDASITVDKVNSSSFMVLKPLLPSDVGDSAVRTVTLPARNLTAFFLFINSHINKNEVFFLTTYGAVCRISGIVSSGTATATTFSYNSTDNILTINGASNCRGQLYHAVLSNAQ